MPAERLKVEGKKGEKVEKKREKKKHFFANSPPPELYPTGLPLGLAGQIGSSQKSSNPNRAPSHPGLRSCLPGPRQPLEGRADRHKDKGTALQREETLEKARSCKVNSPKLSTTYNSTPSSIPLPTQATACMTTRREKKNRKSTKR